MHRCKNDLSKFPPPSLIFNWGKQGSRHNSYELAYVSTNYNCVEIIEWINTVIKSQHSNIPYLLWIQPTVWDVPVPFEYSSTNTQYHIIPNKFRKQEVGFSKKPPLSHKLASSHFTIKNHRLSTVYIGKGEIFITKYTPWKWSFSVCPV